MSVEELAAAGDELVASGSRAEELDRRADELADPLDVVAASPRQVVPAAGGTDLLLPPGHRLVGRLAVLVMRDVREREVETLASEVVPGTDLQERLIVEDVETHQSRAPDAVQFDGVARDGGVEPLDPALPSRHRAELMAALADLVADLVQQLGWKRPVAHPRRICLEDSDREIDLRRRYAAARQRPAGRRIRAGDVGVGAEVQV